MTPSSVAILVGLWIVATGAALAITFRRELLRAWREPVLAAPVLILESDDWGYGPLAQGARLKEIANVMAGHRDCQGKPPVMTLGVVLGGPDTERMAADQWRSYHRLTLADTPLEPIQRAIADGVRSGVFALQLHGLEHFWPPVLMEMSQERSVRTWLTSARFPATETLPSELQSRWVDSSTLPSRPLSPDVLEAAAAEEAEAFEHAFGCRPEVVVPPTFVWTETVERFWFRAGIRVVVTPGRRYSGRDADGKPANVEARFYNAETGPTQVTYLVRDDYFEPAMGHRAEDGLAAVAAKTRLGRPALLETHRVNFLDEQTAARSLVELDKLLSAALRRWPRLRFMASAELASHYLQGSPLVERHFIPRLHCFVLRIARVPRLRKLAWLSGLALPAALLVWATKATREPQAT